MSHSRGKLLSRGGCRGARRARPGAAKERIRLTRGRGPFGHQTFKYPKSFFCINLCVPSIALRRCMKRFLFLLAVALAALPLSAQEESDERILAFDSHITVHQDASMLVLETIRVRSASESIKHGIYRDFPTSYPGRFGSRYTVTFEAVSLERDGKPEPYHTEDRSNGVRIYFGTSSYMLPEGIHTYRFTYRTTRQLGFFKDHDELYWNVTGNAWQFPIDTATATVVLPENVRNLVTELDGSTGYQGEKGKAFTAGRDRQSNPIFRATGLLPQ